MQAAARLGSHLAARGTRLAHATLANACNLQHFRLLQKIADFDGLCKRDSVRTDQD